MSLLLTVLKGGATAGLGSLAGKFLGNGDENIANKLSAQVGCTITQANASQARALLAKGVDPCTGQRTMDTSFDTGLGAPRTTLFPTPGIGGQPIPVFDSPVVTGPGGIQVPASVMQGGSSLEFTRTGLVRNVIVNGRRVSRRNAAAFIRKAGMEVGARGLGLTLQQAATVVLQQSTRPRRRKGISGAQITQARRVINTINSMSKALGCTTRRAPTRRKPTCR